MRHDRFRQKKHGENVRPKCPFELALADLRDAFLRMLLRGIVYQDIDPAQFPLRSRHGRATKIFFPDIAGDQNALATLGFDQPLGLASVFVLIEINDADIGPLLRVQHRHGAPDPAVPARHEGDSVPQFSGADIIDGPRFRLRPHFVLPARPTPLMLWWTKLFLFRHDENKSIFASVPDAVS